MKIAIYAQQLLEKAVQAAKNLEPISFCGMYDAGVDYLFSLSVPLLRSELPKDIRVIPVDLSGVVRKETAASEIGFALADELSDNDIAADYLQLTHRIRRFCEEDKLVMDVYLGQDSVADEEFFLFLNRLRNILGWRFSYVLFMNTKVAFHEYHSTVVEKIVKRNITPILPRNPSDSAIIVHNYEERYGKTVTQVQMETIVRLSGGNSGLIKAMTLQALDDLKWKKPDLLDERLYFRLKGIVDDVPEAYRQLLVEPKASKQNARIFDLLLRYGYLVSEKKTYSVFSPIIPDFIKTSMTKTPHTDIIDRFRVDETILRLSLSQRNVLRYLEGHPGVIVSKDEIAKVLWGEVWADRYSAWAIDQLLSTLREKLTSMRYKGKIVTKKGEGIVFVP